MDDLLKELDEFDVLMKEKGYEGTFATNSGYPGYLKDSVKAYLRESLLGNENGLQNGFTLSCYLKWTGDRSPHVFCYMNIECNASLKFQVTKMNLKLRDRWGNCMREEELKISSNKLIPTLDQAVKKVQEPSFRITRKPCLGI